MTVWRQRHRPVATNRVRDDLSREAAGVITMMLAVEPELVGWILVAAAVLAFEVYCLVHIATRPVALMPRWAWMAICVVSVPLGGVLFLLIGRGHDAVVPPSEAGAAPRRASPLQRVAPTPIDRTAPPALTTAELTKRYGEHLALDRVSLAVPAGSVFGLVGPNGAGKTTLLAVLAGLRRPTSGGVAFDDPMHEVALLPDTPHFEPWLTAWEVVDLARTLTSPHSSPDRTNEALERAGLADVAHRATGGFSRGMLQRLGLAATVVGEPTILLLDEPCSALDPLGRREVLDLVAQLGGDHTVLFCSHILDDVQEVCDTVGVLRDGRLLFQGGLDELLVGRAAPAYTVRARPPLEPVIAALRAADWVRCVDRIGPELLEIGVESAAVAEEQLVRRLASTGAHVVSVNPSGTDLERVFLELVR